ncbi:MAG TPA: hypothetical protein HPP77_07640 [Candidatus Hydrogenedentes bacterium]|nr:hypothetical protein [Candidatus Hydrogenedentota bacterium]
MTNALALSLSVLVVPALCLRAVADNPVRDNTCFQIAAPYSPEVDIDADMAIVYGVNDTFPERVAVWREKGYAVGMMTGIAWGAYAEYFGAGETFKVDEVQTRSDGSLFLHGPDVGYNVPTEPYIAFMKRLAERAIDQGVKTIYFEEPEYWVKAGWSPTFKQAYETFYGEPWQAPDSSDEAQYKASKLKYKLYYDMLADVCAHVDAYASQTGTSVECAVPTHSLINYTHWQIVSPESRLLDIPQLDGYVAQVWTGTARTPINYRGVLKERTFDAAFFEYGQMLAMVRPTGRKVWFLADPVEDNPNRTWDDYKRNYECTVIASLMWPDVHRFEVMPWPERIFRGKYSDVGLESKVGERQGIAADYATQILTITNALNEMHQPDVRYDTGTRGIGVILSDTMMFQREGPGHSDWGMGHFYGQALPLLKAGVPLEPIQLENLGHGALEPYKLILLSYDGQKPPTPDCNERIAQWVEQGGALLYIGNGSDPFHDVPQWWNQNGKTKAKAYESLFARLGVAQQALDAPQAAGNGFVRVLPERPVALSMTPDGPEKVRDAVAALLKCMGEPFRTQNYLCIRRGPFVVAAALEESISDQPFTLEGEFVDLFDAALPVVKNKRVAPGEYALLYDLEWARNKGIRAKVVAAACRVRNETFKDAVFSFSARGPKNTTACARIVLPAPPSRVNATPAVDVERRWDETSATLWLSFPNSARDITFVIELETKTQSPQA